MSWMVRHAGSPRRVEGLTAAQVIEGLEESRWDATDEVRGPADADWVVLEQHPQFEEAVAALEPLPRHDEDEARLDFNPLIDVALVLLIFFILTTSYAALQKVLPMPDTSAKGVTGVLKLTKEKVAETTIKVEVRAESGKPVIRVEEEVVEPADLAAKLRQYQTKTKKTALLIDARGVDWGTVVTVQDAAAGAKISRVHYLIDPGK